MTRFHLVGSPSRLPSLGRALAMGLAALLMATALPSGAGAGPSPGEDPALAKEAEVLGPLQEVNVTLPSGVAPHAVVWDPLAGGFAVTDVGFDTVRLVNASTGSVRAVGPTGQDPSGIAFDSSHGLLWVVNPDSQDVTLVNASTLVTESSASLPDPGYAIAVDDALDVALVPIRDLNELAEVTPSGTLQTVVVGSLPVDVAVDPSLGIAYVANGGGSTVSVVQISPLQVLRTLTVVAQPSGVALDPARGLLLVSSSLSGTLNIYNSTSGGSVAALTLGSGGGRVAVCAAQATALVPAFEGGTVSLVDERTWTVTASYPTPWGPFGVGIDPTCSRFLIADEFAQALTLLVPPGALPFGTIFGSIDPAGPQDALTVNNTQVVLSATGSFSDALPPGTYWLNASAPGYAPSDRQITLSAGQKLRQDIQLERPSGAFPWVLAVEVAVVSAAALALGLLLLFGWQRRRAKRYGDIPKDSPLRRL